VKWSGDCFGDCLCVFYFRRLTIRWLCCRKLDWLSNGKQFRDLVNFSFDFVESRGKFLKFLESELVTIHVHILVEFVFIIIGFVS